MVSTGPDLSAGKKELAVEWLAEGWAVAWPMLAIAALRIVDVSLGVMRTVFVVQDKRALGGLVAAAEAGVWLSAAGIVFSEMTVARAAAFCVGVGLGTMVGVTVTRKMRLGMVTVRVYVPCHAGVGAGSLVAACIRDTGFGATVYRGEGYDGPVDMVLSTVRRRDSERVLAAARRASPGSFASVDNSPVPAMRPVGRV